ncbi:MAG TPA: EscU/YscU/HrcU family type III secretion system export apparatus switch protein [Spirochaetia bacterium]|nr:EscU/YscU/HrcU family type III secretion system export apparatus switch protein [Spirochaetales bacterium]HRS66568.1 EscU/YscU/HrcU family type III secretion system export apparatus switch protein [Spirochaetia bacterium]HOT60070.1 EscU/YscU/HrcU family type III secretion system export apparatus switch protein [Spirochaetales bacterium]HPD79757.1 EscU/YscU/HrcU family type III secretion system export apparatus switch protein [Spirochaetales bacterium]HQK34142.1 EscU/YscU/HrcU family type III
MRKNSKAAALRYTRALPAPLIVARGSGWTADAIIKKAQEHDVPIVENSLLAEQFASLDVGTFVPEEYWELLAEILVAIRKVWI